MHSSTHCNQLINTERKIDFTRIHFHCSFGQFCIEKVNSTPRRRAIFQFIERYAKYLQTCFVKYIRLIYQQIRFVHNWLAMAHPMLGIMLINEESNNNAHQKKNSAHISIRKIFFSRCTAFFLFVYVCVCVDCFVLNTRNFSWK